jgi:hypothetical protein
MADLGAKVGRMGLDVNDSADDQLLFNSSWPTLKIAYQGRADINSLTTQTIVTHNLGYTPAFIVYRVSGTTSKFDSYGTVYNGSGGGMLAANSTELKFFSYGVGSGTVSFYYYIFAQPIDIDYTAPINQTGANVTGQLDQIDRDYGIKATIPGADINSVDLRDYAIHSGTVSPNVHMVENGACTETGTIQPLAKMLRATHGLGYEPMTLFYIDYGSNGSPTYTSGYYYMLGGVGGPAQVRAYTSSTYAWIEDDYSLIPYGSSTATGAILVLKEPFNTVNGYTSTFNV